MEYKVDRNVWESFEGILQMHGKAYVRSLAKKLHVDEKELVKKVFGIDSKLKVELIDTGTDTNCCQAYIRTDSIVHHCRKPVQTGFTFCPIHIIKRPNIIEVLGGACKLKKLMDAPDREALWVKEDGDVVGSDGLFRGTYNMDTGKLKLFII